MLQTISRLLLITFLLSSCAHYGPRVNVGISNPPLNQFNESNYKGKTIAPVPYSETEGWAVYPPESEHKVFNYCAARLDPSTQPPIFDSCISDTASGTFDCKTYVCQIIPEGKGIKCTGVPGQPVPWADSANFVGFNPADHTTLLSFCNIKLL